MSIAMDGRLGIRSLWRRPVPSLVALATLAVGIGGTAAVGSLVGAVLVDPLEYPESDRIVTVWENLEAFGGPVDEWTSEAVARAWREASGETVLAAWTGVQPTLTSSSDPERLAGLAVSDGWFEIFGVAPARGRLFGEEEEGVVVLSDALWRKLGSDPSLVGDVLRLDGGERTVVGILPGDFRPPVSTDLWVPLPLRADADDHGEAYRRVVARLAPGDGMAALEARLEGATTSLAERFPSRMEPVGVTVIPLRERLVGAARPLLLALFAASALVLLVACSNVAAVQLARVSDRRRELALRSALGASRPRLARTLLVEAAILAFAGGGVGAVLASWTGDLLRSAAPLVSPRMSVLANPGPAGELAFLVLGVTLAAGTLAALPALVVGSRVDASVSVRAGDDRGGARSSRLRPVLVAVQLALALALAVGATLLARSLGELMRVDPGFRADAVVTADLALTSEAYDRDGRRRFFRELMERLEARGEISSAGAISRVPLDDTDDSDVDVAVEGRPAEEDSAVWYRVATPGVFRTLRMPFASGGTLATGEEVEAPPVVVNRTFVERRLAGLDPATTRVKIGGRASERGWSSIVGVVGDVRDRALGESARAQMFLRHDDFPVAQMTVAVRAASADGIEGALEALREEVGALDSALPLDRVRTMDRRLADAVAAPRFASGLFGGFAALAVFLAAVGVFGLLTVHVATRRRELGIRISLGADRSALCRDLLGGLLGLVAAGLIGGVLVAAALSRILGSLLYGVDAGDPASWVMPVVALSVAVLVATLRPVLAALRTDPAEILRGD